MSKERELLERIVNADMVEYMRLMDEVEELLAQPEQNNTQYLLDQVSRLTAENAMLKEKWLTKKDDEEDMLEESGYNRSDWWGKE